MIMTVHPGWLQGSDGAVHRATDVGDTAASIIATRSQRDGVVVDGGGHGIQGDTFSLAAPSAHVRLSRATAFRLMAAS